MSVAGQSRRLGLSPATSGLPSISTKMADPPHIRSHPDSDQTADIAGGRFVQKRKWRYLASKAGSSRCVPPAPWGERLCAALVFSEVNLLSIRVQITALASIAVIYRTASFLKTSHHCVSHRSPKRAQAPATYCVQFFDGYFNFADFTFCYVHITLSGCVCEESFPRIADVPSLERLSCDKGHGH
jgi:hypothetical protein